MMYLWLIDIHIAAQNLLMIFMITAEQLRAFDVWPCSCMQSIIKSVAYLVSSVLKGENKSISRIEMASLTNLSSNQI